MQIRKTIKTHVWGAKIQSRRICRPILPRLRRRHGPGRSEQAVLGERCASIVCPRGERTATARAAVRLRLARVRCRLAAAEGSFTLDQMLMVPACGCC